MDNKKAPMWLIPLFLVMAVYFLLASNQTTSDSNEKITLVDPEYISTKYVRDPLTEPIYKKIRMEYKCNSCHENFDTSKKGNGNKGKELVGDHVNLKLNHGANDRCLNCHHRTNREAFVAHDGSEIPYQKSVDLCKKCHGTKHRDWLKGVHGRPTGFWDQTKGESKKGNCTQCHDPHSPKFKPIKPLPGPKQESHKEEGH